VRGRDTIFGGEVKWDEVWTPGANWATTLELSKDVRLNGHPLAKGKYSVWMVVRPEVWTMVFDPRARLFHTRHPDSTPEQIRFDLRPDSAAFEEVLTWSFPEVRVSGATLVMCWAKVRVPLTVEVEPSFTLTMPTAAARPYVGSWEFKWKDSDWGDTATVNSFSLEHKDGRLLGTWTREPWPDAGPFALLPLREKWFSLVLMEKGEVYEIADYLTFEYRVQGGLARSFELRGEKDEVVGVGTRSR
jgi:hypothetical protein